MSLLREPTAAHGEVNTRLRFVGELVPHSSVPVPTFDLEIRQGPMRLMALRSGRLSFEISGRIPNRVLLEVHLGVAVLNLCYVKVHLCVMESLVASVLVFT